MYEASYWRENSLLAGIMTCLSRPLQAETEASIYHTSKVISTTGVEVQTVNKDYLWVGKAETRVKTFGRNKTTLGFSASRMDERVLPRKVTLPASHPSSTRPLSLPPRTMYIFQVAVYPVQIPQTSS